MPHQRRISDISFGQIRMGQAEGSNPSHRFSLTARNPPLPIGSDDECLAMFERGIVGGSGPATPSALPKRLAILVIDDNFEYADSLRDLLELYGHRADVATDGPSGLRLASAGLCDAILCDIGLPGMSGYEVAQHLRSERATSGISIAVTAYGSTEAKRPASMRIW